jgi:hypothetical protein
MSVYDEKIYEVTDLLKEFKYDLKLDENVKPKKEDIEGVKGGIYLKNFFTKNECKQLIDISEKLGYQIAPLNTLESTQDKAVLSKSTLTLR